MKYNEIIEKLSNSDIAVWKFAYGDFDPESLKLGEIKEIEQIGGEGEGDHWHSVKYFPEHDVYIKVTGYYQSHYGTDFDGGFKDCCQEVKPKQKTITVYE